MEGKPHRIAFLIDTDNIPPDGIEVAQNRISAQGNVVIRRGYGNFFDQRLTCWQKTMNCYAIQPVQVNTYTTGKNASDIALVIDAMDQLCSGRADAFCFVTSDSDFTGLAIYFREKGIPVYGVGEAKTPEAFQNACTEFFLITPAKAVPCGGSSEKHTPGRGAQEEMLLTIDKAILLAESGGQHIARLCRVGMILKSLNKNFSPKNWGCHTLLDLIRKFPDRYRLTGSQAKITVQRLSR